MIFGNRDWSAAARTNSKTKSPGGAHATQAPKHPRPFRVGAAKIGSSKNYRFFFFAALRFVFAAALRFFAMEMLRH